MSDTLERQAYERLANLSRNYGQITLDKLVSVADVLGEFEAVAAGTAHELAGIDALAIAEDGSTRVLLGEWPSFRRVAVPDSDTPTLLVWPAADGAEVVVARRFGRTDVFGRVSMEYLLRTNGLLDRGVEVCLFATVDPGREPFYCSAGLEQAALPAMQAQARTPSDNGALQWRVDGEEWLGAQWQLFLPSRFTAEPWLVLVSEQRAAALAVVTTLGRVVLQMAVLTLALVIILAVSQIRRTLTPLKELLAGTQRIAAHDFGTPVRIATHDEFATLGTALNGMAQELDHQFTTLRALAEIDRLILESTEIDRVIELLLTRLSKLVPDARHLVLILDRDDPRRGRIYQTNATVAVVMERTTVAADVHDWLTARHSAASLGRADAQPLTSIDPTLAGRCLYLAPLVDGRDVGGALLTVKRDDSHPSEREAASISELSARVAVAIAASKREAELFRRAHYDPLTGLPNRELFHDRLHQAVAQAEREVHQLAVLFIDLDGFKAINDTRGHPGGDELLKETAQRLAAVLRHADTVARLGGDEYAIVLPRVHGPLEAETIAVRAIECVRRPFKVADQDSFVSASIGIAMFPEDGRTATELLRRADMAMYNAKDAGKGCYRFFAEEMDKRIQERHTLHNDLRGALAAGEFFLAYQPQRAMGSGRYVSAEALLRWRHPRRGILSPALFVPLLEETGLIVEVGKWVLHQALLDCAAWRRAGIVFERVAVNASALQLLDPDFVAVVTEALCASELSGQHLEIELTEASLVRDFRTTNDTLSKLRELGVTIAVDDFGTGYSSLSYLNDLVFDVLKIDRAFVTNLPTPKSIAIVRAIIAVADSLGKRVIAEGVETESHYSQLLALGCDYAQGYLLSKPLDHAGLIAFARDQARELSLPANSGERIVGRAGGAT